MKTNYKSKRTPEAREIIVKIARRATNNMLEDRDSLRHYAKIVDACMKDIKTYGIEAD